MIISYAQNFEDVMLWRALRHIKNGFYIDVGANDPVIDSVTHLFYEHDWSGINIEPLVSHWDALKRVRSRDINLCCAVGATIGSVSLWQSEIRGWSTASAQVIEHHQSNGHTGTTLDVALTTLDEVWERHVREDVHFLKIDVEGFERQVLEGLDLERHRPWIMVIEATVPGSTRENFDTWEFLLTQARYALVYADGVNRFYLAHEHGQLADAFKYPPNIFDGFVKAPAIQGNLWAREISDRAEEAARERVLADARTRQAEALIVDLRLRLADAEAKVQDLRDAKSGNLLAAVRVAMTERSPAISVQPRMRLRRLVGRTARLIGRSPRLRGIGVKALSPFPALKGRLKRLVLGAAGHEHSGPPVPAALAHLSPRVRQIHEQLQRARLRSDQATELPMTAPPIGRPRLAYVSPLPPVRSGIADYSAELLPALADYYDIDVIIEQSSLSDDDGWIETHCGVRSSKWLLDHVGDYARVLYHFGNSPAHDYMFSLLERVPGIVVLHDFNLAEVLSYREACSSDGFALQRGLYRSHGYGALLHREMGADFAQLAATYPANVEVLQRAQALIVHSLHAKRLAHRWYGPLCANKFSVIPLLRRAATNRDRTAARQALGIASDAFIVCSFGVMGPTKLCHIVLQAWAGSRAATDEACRLIFVGEEPSSEYGRQIRSAIEAQNGRHRIQVTGWNPPDRYRQYLMAADVAIQLRSRSRGETSAAVLDCMNYAVPTVVNAHGALAELPADAVWMLGETFSEADLVKAIDTLRSDGQIRDALSRRARDVVLTDHDPTACARQYQQVIEKVHSEGGLEAAVMSIARSGPSVEGLAEDAVVRLAESVARRLPPLAMARQLFVDVSATCRSDLRTGIQRVVRALTWSLIHSPPAGYRVEPVYLTQETGRWHYRYARQWTAEACAVRSGWMPDDPIDATDGDVLLIVDYLSTMAVEAEQSGLYASLQTCGVDIQLIVHDLLPIQMPQHFPPGERGFPQWLNTLTARADSAICVSRSVAEDLRQWMRAASPRLHPLRIEWFHLGADLINSMPTRGLPPNSVRTLGAIRSAPSFLMVGTLEPRKGYLQCLRAFSQLWDGGLNINLVIVGQEGWRGLPDSERRGIPGLVKLISAHPESGKRLLWLSCASDEFLASVYAESVCLIAASEGEGFGLPLIEAARHGLPIIARDIPVFREVAGNHASYFSGLEPSDLARAVEAWLKLKRENKHTASAGMNWHTWQESALQLVQAMHLRSVIDNTLS